MTHTFLVTENDEFLELEQSENLFILEQETGPIHTQTSVFSVLRDLDIRPKKFKIKQHPYFNLVFPINANKILRWIYDINARGIFLKRFEIDTQPVILESYKIYGNSEFTRKIQLKAGKGLLGLIRLKEIKKARKAKRKRTYTRIKESFKNLDKLSILDILDRIDNGND